MKITRLLFAVLLFSISFNLQAKADDSNASLLMRLFSHVCLPNMGQPEKVRDFAAEKKLVEIKDAKLLDNFVGPGDKGAAWLIPSPTPQKFALSIRGTTQACAVWAEQADPKYLEDAFVKLMKETERPGIKVTKDKEITNETKLGGQGKVIMYELSDPNSPKAMEFTLITAEKPGALIQGSIQVVPVSKH